MRKWTSSIGTNRLLSGKEVGDPPNLQERVKKSSKRRG